MSFTSVSDRKRANHAGTQAPSSISPAVVPSADIVRAVSTSDFDVANSVALADVPGLTFAIGANETWKFRANLLLSFAGNVGGARVAMNGPVGATDIRFVTHLSKPSTTPANQITVDAAFDADETLLITAGAGWCVMEGTIANGVNAGTIAVRWAQLTSDADASSVKRGSSLEAFKIS